MGLLLTNALSAANEVIIPMQAQPFSVVGMSQLTNSISSVQRKITPGLHIRGVLLLDFMPVVLVGAVLFAVRRKHRH